MFANRSACSFPKMPECPGTHVPESHYTHQKLHHSKCSRNAFYSSKHAFWYLNQLYRTSGSGFFTQIGVKLAQKCSERWDLQLCENFLTPKIFSPSFTRSLQMFQNHILLIKSYILVPESTGLDKWKRVFHLDRGKTSRKVLKTVRSATLWKFSDPKKILQFSPDHSKCSRITLCSSKAAFWYLNQPDRTSGSRFITQIGVKLAQKCSERWDIHLCESFDPKKKFLQSSPNHIKLK